MSIDIGVAMTPRLGFDVSPALIAFGELLMLPYGELRSVVEDELRENAALERVDAGTCPVCRGGWSTRCPACAAGSGGATGRGRTAALGPMADAGDLAMAEPDTHVLLRTVLCETAAADAPIAEYVVDSLDQHGLLDRSCGELAAELAVDRDALLRVVERVRRAGPPGVGATSVQECLLLQLDVLGLDEECALLTRRVIADHLPPLARGRFGSIAAALGCTGAQVEQSLELIRHRLRPYPVFDGNRSAVASYVVPDVVLREDAEAAGVFTVELVEPALIRLRVRPGLSSGSQATSFLGQLRDRWETLRRVAEYTVRRQQAFLAHGPRRCSR